MKKRKTLAELLFEDDRILKEEEEDGGDDIFGDDDAGDDDAGDEEEASDDEEGGDEEGGDEEAADEEEEEDSGDDSEDEGSDSEEESPAGPADDTIDGEVNNLLADFEAEAVASAEQEAELQGESAQYIHKRPISKLLFEADDVVFDVSSFTSNIARVIDNYQTLLDVEKMIFDKAKSFLAAKYGDPVADEFETMLDADYQISFVTGAGSDSSVSSDDSTPIAAGAVTPV